ncbi:MAG: PAS domain-containing sensor histidine kinase [Candidatus Obscuribacterales bacterium]|nr:PAS domain-containing sensor histidine kinase [Candidatus Obscuribacterales bacterium]
MKFRLRLLHKALIVLAVPLVLQLSLVLLLGAFLCSAQFEVNQERKAAELSRIGSNFISSFYQAAAELGIYYETKDVLEYERGIQAIEGIRTSLVELRQLVGADEYRKPIVERISLLVKKGLDSLSRSEETVKDWHLDRSEFQQRATMKAISLVADQLKVEFKNLCRVHNRSDVENAQYEAQIQRSISFLLVFAALMNVLLAVAMGILFSRDIAKRVSIVRDNSILLAASQPLQPRLSGNDEIAELDAAFHSVAGALKDAARRERAIVDNAADVICSISQDFRFTAVSPACRNLWGYEESELLGKNCLSLVPEIWSQPTSNAFKNAINSADTYSFENQIRHRDGSLVHTLWSGCWSQEEQSLFCVAHDISDRKKLEQLKHDFLAMISHDLRTPLCSFQFFLSMIASGRWKDLPEQLVRHAESAENEATRLIALVNDLLDIAKMESGNMELSLEEVPITAIVDRSMESIRHFAEQRGVALESSGKEAIVFVNEGRIVQVLVNLLSNAIKFSSQNSRVFIDVEVIDAYAKVSVHDSGPGIASDEQKRIFNRFEQVRGQSSKEFASTGLGLAICKAIIEEHAGEIGVVSELGKGSQFWFTVPLSNGVDVSANPQS